MMDKNQVYNDELEQMRQDMSELRSLLSEQKIVNERLMRRAMKSELDKERRVTLQTLLPSLFTLPLFYFMQPLWGLPLWFVGVTIAYLLLAVVFSIWSVRRLTGEDLLAGDLLKVAGHIVEYKRLGNNWLKFSISFLIVWLIGFFYYCGQGMEENMANGMLWGGVVGGLTGLACGIYFLMQSRRRLNGVLRQIEDLKTGEQ